MAGIVHFANFFRYMESAECAFLRSLGLGVKIDWEGQTLGFPRVSATCDYLSPARFEDVLDVDVSVLTIGDKSVTYGFEFTCARHSHRQGPSDQRLLPGAWANASGSLFPFRRRIEPSWNRF